MENNSSRTGLGSRPDQNQLSQDKIKLIHLQQMLKQAQTSFLEFSREKNHQLLLIFKLFVKVSVHSIFRLILLHIHTKVWKTRVGYIFELTSKHGFAEFHID